MGVALHLISLLACLQTVRLYPMSADRNSLYENYGMRLAKRPFYSYRDALLSPFGLLDPSKVSQGQRKKAVDSTFIRFGRSSPDHPGRNERSIDDIPDPESLSQIPRESMEEDFKTGPQRFLLDHNGCRVRDSTELMRALMSDPKCIRAFQKAKKENVNDTFIRFGKREAPPEREFEEAR
ncbi:hypothetical protein JTE90_001663 [Oedothorax gibbosus]|uniref:Uncharacterized protein n=1 Tax=Oedothorax gibbosus TaxID=931172 RepID=A0AAV6UUF2_9ARAC|nr:hypothetical protein JTE90_001663 [Oedothorax gibbosus]